jgi:hypothetical protein
MCLRMWGIILGRITSEEIQFIGYADEKYGVFFGSGQRPRQHNHRIALYGLGGMGKTQVALEYAYRHKDDYRYAFWVSAVHEAQIQSGFGNVTRLVGRAKSW